MAIEAKILRSDHVAAGLTLQRHYRTAALLHNGIPVCHWLVTSVSPTIPDIWREANKYVIKGVTDKS